jgi:hypothetical protein
LQLKEFCHCCVESKKGRIRRMKYWQTTVAILATLLASIGLAEDFKTINGKEYKNATVSRVEPDGIVIKSKSGISKVYFTELPKEVQQRFNYDPEKAAAYSAEQDAAYEQIRKQQEAATQQTAETTRKNNEQLAKPTSCYAVDCRTAGPRPGFASTLRTASTGGEQLASANPRSRATPGESSRTVGE